MAPTTLPPAERPRVTPPWPRSPSCRTRNPHNVVGDVGILSSLGLPGRRVPMLVRAPGDTQAVPGKSGVCVCVCVCYRDWAH